MSDSFTSMHDVPLHIGKGHGKGTHDLPGPPDAVLREIDAQELNRMFVRRCEMPASWVCSTIMACAPPLLTMWSLPRLHAQPHSQSVSYAHLRWLLCFTRHQLIDLPQPSASPLAGGRALHAPLLKHESMLLQ